MEELNEYFEDVILYIKNPPEGHLSTIYDIANTRIMGFTQNDSDDDIRSKYVERFGEDDDIDTVMMNIKSEEFAIIDSDYIVPIVINPYHIINTYINFLHEQEGKSFQAIKFFHPHFKNQVSISLRTLEQISEFATNVFEEDERNFAKVTALFKIIVGKLLASSRNITPFIAHQLRNIVRYSNFNFNEHGDNIIVIDGDLNEYKDDFIKLFKTVDTNETNITTIDELKYTFSMDIGLDDTVGYYERTLGIFVAYLISGAFPSDFNNNNSIFKMISHYYHHFNYIFNDAKDVHKVVDMNKDSIFKLLDLGEVLNLRQGFINFVDWVKENHEIIDEILDKDGFNNGNDLIVSTLVTDDISLIRKKNDEAYHIGDTTLTNSLYTMKLLCKKNENPDFYNLVKFKHHSFYFNSFFFIDIIMGLSDTKLWNCFSLYLDQLESKLQRQKGTLC